MRRSACHSLQNMRDNRIRIRRMSRVVCESLATIANTESRREVAALPADALGLVFESADDAVKLTAESLLWKVEQPVQQARADPDGQLLALLLGAVAAGEPAWNQEGDRHLKSLRDLREVLCAWCCASGDPRVHGGRSNPNGAGQLDALHLLLGEGALDAARHFSAQRDHLRRVW